ncbi:MAG: class I SAM-dependent methyltransferase [Ignavibacteriaceae bacterium]|nr:class I SAM-dependent methyltransferase [Ignavibacteriaceae bacterium]
MGKFGDAFWNERFSTDEYIYGTIPNKFFKEQIDKLKPGRLLLLGEGEGRNSVYAATKGWNVDAIDFSQTAREKALLLAKQNDVNINYTINNLADFIPNENCYDAIGLIFVHLKPDSRNVVHERIVNALKNNGSIILEAFEKQQLGKKSGGPQSEEMLYSIEELKDDFKDLKIHILEEKTVLLDEGDLHKGKASVIRFVAEKL